jgi:hypothetical protein
LFGFLREVRLAANRLATASALLVERFPETLPAAQPSWAAVPTGVAQLDRIFPSGGLQRGRLSAWAPGPGAAALLRAACHHTIEQGERAAWIDAAALATGTAWRTGPVLVCPAGPVAALRATEVLARSGGFALVVLDGLEPGSAEMVRLSRAAHEGGVALVLLTGVTALASLRVATRARVGAYGWRRSRSGGADDITSVTIEVEARASGWRARTELAIPVWHDDLRLSLDPGRTDRRGERR